MIPCEQSGYCERGFAHDGPCGPTTDSASDANGQCRHGIKVADCAGCAPIPVRDLEAEVERLREALEGVLPFVLFLPVQSSVIEDGLAAARRARAALAGVRR